MKKQLTADDLALLKSRGKVTSLTTVTEFTIPSFEKPKKAKKRTAKKDNPNANHPLVGRMLHTSWGYSMTINNFAKIIEVSPSGKTVVCRMLPKEGFNGFAGKVTAGNNMFGPKFRLKVKSCDWGTEGLSFNGSYPFTTSGFKNDSDGFVNKEKHSLRMGYFSLYNGREVYENHMD